MSSQYITLLFFVTIFPLLGQNQKTEVGDLYRVRRSEISSTVNNVSVPLMDSMLNVFFVEAKINGKRVSLLLDTGASFTMLSPEAAERIGLEVVEGPNAKLRSASGQIVEAKFAQTKRISIGDAWTEDEFVTVAKIPKAARDGVLGLSTLIDWDLRIDPAKKKFMVFPAGKAPPLNDEKVLKMTTIFDKSYPQGLQLQGIRVLVTVNNRKLLGVPDTGYSGTLSLTESWVKKNAPNLMKGASIESAKGVDASGVVKSREVKLPIFHFGSDELRNFPVELSNNISGAKRPLLIGNKLLGHYIVTISFSKNEFRLKSLGTVQNLTKTSKKQGAGISFRLAEDGGIFIQSLTPTGIAAKAGLMAGDEVLEMGGIPMKTIKPKQFEALKELSVVKVRYRRGKSDPVEVDLVLEKTE